MVAGCITGAPCTCVRVCVVYTGWHAVIAPVLLAWLLNGLLAVAVLVSLFTFGEPVTKPASAASVSYWRHRSQADQYLRRASTTHTHRRTAPRHPHTHAARPTSTCAGQVPLHTHIQNTAVFLWINTACISCICCHCTKLVSTISQQKYCFDLLHNISLYHSLHQFL